MEVERIDRRENLIRLIDQYKNLIFSICLKMTGDYFASEDICQETFISAYDSYEKFDGRNEKAWICRIASNKCIDYLRSAAAKERRFTDDTDAISEMPSKEKDLPELYICEEVLEKVKTGCEALSDSYREIAKAYFIEGLSAKEIADKTSINIKTVQTGIYRAREYLKKTLRREDLLT